MPLHSLDRPDTSLLDELRDGSSAALAALFDRHVDAVHAYCFRRTASWHLAEDATSTVFLELWRGRSRVQEHDGSALPWLLGIARNVCRSNDRSLRRLTRALHRLPGGESLLEADPAEDYALFGLGMALTRTGDLAEAVEHLALACAMCPDNKHYATALRTARARKG
jgi:DNA-directed RNA polymerase specialized sigma24 family protein